MDRSTSILENAKSFIEIIGKLSLGILGICYALGLVVLNTYFSRYGIHTLSLFQTNYITAGVWALSPVLLTWVVTIFGIWVLSHFKSKFTKFVYRRYSPPAEFRPHRDGIKQLSSIVLWFCMVGILVVGIVNLRIEFNRRWIAITFVGVMLGWLLVVLTLDVVNRKNRRLKLLIVLLTVFLTLGLVWYSRIFGNEVYSTIPSHVGGGAPNMVQFIVEPDANVKMFFESMGIHFQGDSNRTEAVPLLLSTDDEYIIITSEREHGALSIRRDFVKALFFEGAPN